MWLLFAILSFVLLIILIWQQIQHKELEREINYITDRLVSLSITSDNGFVLIPTDNDSIKKLGAVLNTLLQDFYTKKSEFEQSKQAMAQVLTNISHDIRTPLTVLKGNSEMLSNITNDPSMPENVHAMADKIDRKADDLISTINDYFTMSKIASGDLPIKLKKENVSRLCQDTILDYYCSARSQWQLVAVHKPGRKTKVSHLPTVKARCQVEIRTQMLKKEKKNYLEI